MPSVHHFLRRVDHSPLGLVWYRFRDQVLDAWRGMVMHAMFTRLGGVSGPPFASLNLGNTVGDAPRNVRENYRRVLATLGLEPRQVVSPHQVHGAHVAVVDTEDGGAVIPETDALITNKPELALLLRFADCVPVLFYDPSHQAIGLAHAGWRGIVAGVVPATIAAMQRHFGSRPSDLWTGIGPAIGPDHYAVGEEVVAAIQGTVPGAEAVTLRREGQWYLDLAGAVKAQLVAQGVTRVSLANICTACNVAEWYSHREEGGTTGRFGVLIMLLGSMSRARNLKHESQNVELA